LAFTGGAVVTAAHPLWIGGLALGEYFTGLTRDDVGGLRYLYAGKDGTWNNRNIENLIVGTTGSGFGDCPWCPVGGTNTVSTNGVMDLALRPGVDKITFQLGQYDSLLGSFITVTNQYDDRFYTNSKVIKQTTERVLTQPDILFSAEDLGLNAAGVPWLIRRTDTVAWINNNALNGQAALDGPGVIQPQVVITYSKLGPYYYNWTSRFPESLQEAGAWRGALWGSFDGTANPPVIFPDGFTVRDLEQLIFIGY
jgi:hypothetical protein